MKTIETINIEPSTNLIDVIASEYSFNSAISDLIDNCIDGKANKIKLIFLQENKRYSLLIVDNGIGMTRNQLSEAAIIGFKSSQDLRNNSALGRYSTGLKSASNFLANSVFVTSKTAKKEFNTLKIDFAELKKTGKWLASFLGESYYNNLIDDHGTIVLCDGLKNIDSTNDLYEKIDSLKIYLNHVFGKFLLNNILEISISTSLGAKPLLLKGWDPFYLPKNKSTKCVLDKHVPFKGKSINFKVYILPSYTSLTNEDQNYMSGGGNNSNLNKLQGFYVYRSERLISEASWLLPEFDITEKTRYARVEVQIPSSLDKYFNVNLTKTKIDVPKELEGHFRSIAQKARSESNKNYDYKKHPETKPKLNKKDDTIWVSVNTANGVALRLNKDSIILKDMCKKLSDYEFNQLINLISKSFPLGFAMSQNVNPEQYSENEILSMAKNLYYSLFQQGIETKEIYKKISQMEPFNQHLSMVVGLIEELEKEKKDD